MEALSLTFPLNYYRKGTNRKSVPDSESILVLLETEQDIDKGGKYICMRNIMFRPLMR